MPDITWPVDGGYAFWPDAHDEALEYQVELTVKRSGGVETLSLPGARWTSTLRFADAAVSRREERARLQAFLATLRGGANRLLLWNLAQPEPLGNARGAPVLAGPVAAGAVSATIDACTAAPNLLRNSGFEIDTNGDGLSDGVVPYNVGNTGTVTYSRSAIGMPGSSGLAQVVQASALGNTGGDRAGVYLGSVSAQAGATYTLAASVNATTGVSVGVYFNFINAASAVLGDALQSWTAAPGGQRVAATGTAPAGTVRVDVYVWMAQAPVNGQPALLYVDSVQFEPGAQATAYAGLPRLRAGDRIAWGGQRVMLTADAPGNDAGTMVLQFEPARRAASLAGAAVTLVRPTTRYVVTSPVVPMPAMGTVLPGFAIELVEA